MRYWQCLLFLARVLRWGLAYSVVVDGLFDWRGDLRRRMGCQEMLVSDCDCHDGRIDVNDKDDGLSASVKLHHAWSTLVFIFAHQQYLKTVRARIPRTRDPASTN